MCQCHARLIDVLIALSFPRLSLNKRHLAKSLSHINIVVIVWKQFYIVPVGRHQFSALALGGVSGVALFITTDEQLQ